MYGADITFRATTYPLPTKKESDIGAYVTIWREYRCLPRGILFCEQWKPEFDFDSNDAMGIRLSLQDHGMDLVCCEWRPSCYTFVASVRRYQGQCFAHEPDRAEVHKQMGERQERNGKYLDILCGLVWADVELNDFAHAVSHLCPNASVAITP